MGDTHVRGVCAENRMDMDTGAEGKNMRATFINSLVGITMKQDLILLCQHKLDVVIPDLHYLGPRFQHFLWKSELPTFLRNIL